MQQKQGGTRSLLALVSLCITLSGVCAVPAYAQGVTTSATPAVSPSPAASELPDDPANSRFPNATPIANTEGEPVTLEANEQRKDGDIYTLSGDVLVTSPKYEAIADKVVYNSATQEVEATGNVHLRGTGNEQESISATHAIFNMKDGTGTFYDVLGSLGLKTTTHGTVYTVGNPFLFSGRVVKKVEVESYLILDGSVTSCQLPHPDWRLSAAKFTVRNGSATAKNTTFHLLNMPIVFLPWVSHPTDAESRESGFMIPVVGQSSTKGFILGEEYFLVLGRSMDLMVGADYFSKRGWAQTATFRYKGPGFDSANIHYQGLLDRGYTPTGGVYTNQGGEDMVVSGRKDLDEHSRVAANVEYLSSYIYREAFTDNFNQAVASDINSHLYASHESNGIAEDLYFDRYQGLKRVATATQTEQEVRIFHVPSLDFSTMERPLGQSPLVWSSENSFTAMKRVQSNGYNSAISERLDIHPRISLPMGFAGFRFRPTVGFRDTYYTHSRVAAALPGPNPIEQNTGLNRTQVEAEFELRPPVLERDFSSGFLTNLLGRDVRHTIEPYFKYRYANGVNRFSSTLRFDATDVVADTNEVVYGVTQRLFLRPTKQHECGVDETPTEEGSLCGGTRESLRWRLEQRRYFNQTFSNALVTFPGTNPNINRRNVFDTTLDFSGVAFLTEARPDSPILSNLRLSANDHFDFEWDVNYDIREGRFNQSNTFLNYHVGQYFGGISHARLNAPGRFQSIDSDQSTITATSAISDFSQLRVLLGYGTPTKQGLSMAANVGLDLKDHRGQTTAAPGTPAVTTTVSNNLVQYMAIQTSYNWNCCGLSIEYRKFELGPVRNENVYRFNFTLANIGTAGNLRHAERLF